MATRYFGERIKRNDDPCLLTVGALCGLLPSARR